MVNIGDTVSYKDELWVVYDFEYRKHSELGWEQLIKASSVQDDYPIIVWCFQVEPIKEVPKSLVTEEELKSRKVPLVNAVKADRTWEGKITFSPEGLEKLNRLIDEVVEEGDVVVDEVNPDHYKRSKEVLGVEVADILDFFFPDDPHLWTVGKYLLRHGHKESSSKDLYKAKWFLDRRISQE